MTSPAFSTWARPPSRRMKWLSDHSTFIGGSVVRDGINSGRRPAISDSSAVRAAVLAERTAAKVAHASTRVPPAVANDEIVAQSAIGLEAKRLWRKECRGLRSGQK